MTDYYNWQEWKHVELHKHQVCLSEETEYQIDDLTNVFLRLLDTARSEGLQGCYLKFSSTFEQYEDYLGPVAVTACGYRKLNEQEKADIKKDEEVRAFAEELGVSEYEARIVYNLKKRGKL